MSGALSAERLSKNPIHMTDLELMEALRGRDPDAMGSLVDRYGRRIFKYLLGWVKNREDALDLTQEVFLRISEKADLYQGDGPLSPWIFRIAHNLFHDHLRKRNYRVHNLSISLDEPLDSRQESSSLLASPERSTLSVEISSRVQEAMGQLPIRQREVVQLRLLGELQLEEISQSLGLTVGGVKSTLHNALARLRRELSDLREQANDKM